MLDNNWPGWSLMQSGITGMAGLLGVATGGLITALNQKRERKNALMREQLRSLYAPLIAILLEIRSKSEVRVKLSSAARDSWVSLFEGVQSPTIKQRIDDTEKPAYIKLFDYNNKQLTGQIVPLYRKMLEVLSNQIGLAEPSTLNHFPALVEFVEIWNRFLDGSLPENVLDKIEHKEETLTAFYDDLKTQSKRLSEAIRN